MQDTLSAKASLKFNIMSKLYLKAAKSKWGAEDMGMGKSKVSRKRHKRIVKAKINAMLKKIYGV